MESLPVIEDALKRGENIIFLSNHQTEPDPAFISIAFEHLGYSSLAEKIIYVAGDRIRSDVLSVPFSLGRNLLCVHSRKHVDNFPEEDKSRRQRENLMTIHAMATLLREGGAVIWVAPSGGRDRASANGKFNISPFDLKTVQMFHKMAMKTDRPTWFYPMAMSTAELCPPPPATEKHVGEKRTCKATGLGLAIGKKVDASQQDPESLASAVEAEVHSLYEKIYV
eukprot:GHVU01136541.1.p1 GENE.GHVU01136541.1~~GHVU01136541.1.p1  ORF type:complete len:224 (-),score=21.34 GHVU01136541.1:159-830(-)